LRWRQVLAHQLAEEAGLRSARRDEWSFYEGRELVVLCLWRDSILFDGAVAVHPVNMRRLVASVRPVLSGGKKEPEGMNCTSRARRYELTAQTAQILEMPVVIVLAEGSMPEGAAALTEPLELRMRVLDNRLWSVSDYNLKTGDTVLTRTGRMYCAEMWRRYGLPA
jgi:hypothetical protein